mgnify:CR=1 FL=1
MFTKIQISPGVSINVGTAEVNILNYLNKQQFLLINNLDSELKYVIKKLISKSIVIRTKRGNNVYIQLRNGIKISKD